MERFRQKAVWCIFIQIVMLGGGTSFANGSSEKSGNREAFQPNRSHLLPAFVRYSSRSLHPIDSNRPFDVFHKTLQSTVTASSHWFPQPMKLAISGNRSKFATSFIPSRQSRWDATHSLLRQSPQSRCSFAFSAETIENFSAFGGSNGTTLAPISNISFNLCNRPVPKALAAFKQNASFENGYTTYDLTPSAPNFSFSPFEYRAIFLRNFIKNAPKTAAFHYRNSFSNIRPRRDALISVTGVDKMVSVLPPKREANIPRNATEIDPAKKHKTEADATPLNAAKTPQSNQVDEGIPYQNTIDGLKSEKVHKIAFRKRAVNIPKSKKKHSNGSVQKTNDSTSSKNKTDRNFFPSTTPNEVQDGNLPLSSKPSTSFALFQRDKISASQRKNIVSTENVPPKRPRRKIRRRTVKQEINPDEPKMHIVPRTFLYPIAETRTRPNKREFFVRPLIARYEQPDKIENTFLYPFGQDFRQPNRRYGYCFFTLCRYDNRVENGKIYREGYFFPFYFYKRGYGANDYSGIWPIGGTVKNMFGKQRIDWCGWPLYVKTHRNGDVNQWLPFPLINKRSSATSGFAFYPLGGHFYNNKKDLRYFLWPLGYDHHFYDKQHVKKGFIPFYTYEKKPNVEDLSIVWPFFGHRREQNPTYEEHRILWPLWVQGRGERRLVNRWAPFYTHSEQAKGHRQKTWYLWPLLKEQSWRENGIDVTQQQVLYFLLWCQEQRAHDTKRFLGRKTHFWPFFSSWNNGNGRKQVQIFSPFDVFFQNNPRVRDIYNPLFYIFRFDQDGDTVRYGALFNLFQEYRNRHTHERDLRIFFLLRFTKTPKMKCFSLLKGLFEYKKIEGKVSLRLFWLPSLAHNKKSKPTQKL